MKLALSALLFSWLMINTALAEELKFEFNGQCGQACDAANLNLGDAVSGWLTIDRSYLPSQEGETLFVSNAHITDLSFIYGSELFDYSDVVKQDSTLFSMLNGQLIIMNGVNLLASNGSANLLISPAGTGYSLPTVSAWLQQSSTASWGSFAVSNVPEPSMAALLLAGLGCIAFARKKWV